MAGVGWPERTENEDRTPGAPAGLGWPDGKEEQ